MGRQVKNTDSSRMNSCPRHQIVLQWVKLRGRTADPIVRRKRTCFNQHYSLSFLHSLNNTILKKCTSWERYVTIFKSRQTVIFPIHHKQIDIDNVEWQVIRPQAKNSRKMSTVVWKSRVTNSLRRLDMRRGNVVCDRNCSGLNRGSPSG